MNPNNINKAVKINSKIRELSCEIEKWDSAITKCLRFIERDQKPHIKLFSRGHKSWIDLPVDKNLAVGLAKSYLLGLKIEKRGLTIRLEGL